MKNGHLTKQSEQPSNGKGPCHLSLDAHGKVILAANYGSGSTICLGLADDGSLLPLITHKKGSPGGFIQHTGHGPNKTRQETPHGHSINTTSDSKFAISCDLGADRVFVDKLDVSAASLTPHTSASTQPGGGPRHFAIHPRLPFGYANNELDMTVTAFRFDAVEGRLKKCSRLVRFLIRCEIATGFQLLRLPFIHRENFFTCQIAGMIRFHYLESMRKRHARTKKCRTDSLPDTPSFCDCSWWQPSVCGGTKFWNHFSLHD